MTLERYLEISKEEGVPLAVARQLWDRIDFASQEDEDKLRRTHKLLFEDPELVKSLRLAQADLQ